MAENGSQANVHDAEYGETSQRFSCPNCGESEWRAEYYQLVSQDVTLVADEDGQPDAADYGGDEEAYDESCTPNERYVCQACEHQLVLGVFQLVSLEAQTRQHALVTAARATIALIEDGGSLRDDIGGRVFRDLVSAVAVFGHGAA